MRNLLILAASSLLSIVSALLSVYGTIGPQAFILATVPGLAVSLWLICMPQEAFQISENHPRSYIALSGTLSVLSLWWMVAIFTEGQYLTLVWYGTTSIVMVLLLILDSRRDLGLDD